MILMEEKRSAYLVFRISLGGDENRPAHDLERGHKEDNRHYSRNQGTSSCHDCRRNHCISASGIGHSSSNDHCVVGEYKEPKYNQKNPVGDPQFPVVFPPDYPFE